MLPEIRTLNLGGVNCYLVKTSAGFLLIDTGFSGKRADLEKELASAGCKPGDLKLVILTHGCVHKSAVFCSGGVRPVGERRHPQVCNLFPHCA